MDSLRAQLLEYLKGGHAHAEFADAVKNLPPEFRGKKPNGSPHSAWQLLEHLRIAQHDVLEFSRDAHHISPPWPEGYWPTEPAPPSAEAWDDSIAAFDHDLEAFRHLIGNPKLDLLAKIPHGTGQTLFREAMLIVDHNAYHLGQLVLLRNQLGIWPG